MDIAEILRHILIVLIAAKAAAELAERIGVPAVVGEILAGIVIGPSLLNAVGGDDEVLRTLGEIGVILLLLDVGLEMDLRELGRVGRTSLLVAGTGVVAPMALGVAAMRLMGEDGDTALFVGAALTATSVGITARVFGDLRALATTEARIVLGAAVADDVIGLVVLTVVVRLVSGGSVSVLSVCGIIAVAVLFLLLGGVVGLRVAPPLFAAIDRVSRSTGTLVALALAFTLGFAELADQAKLAPIVGAFVAGIALSKARQSERIRRELTPVGHLFIPVFFLQIGIQADIRSFGRPQVLQDAAILLTVAVVGKLLAAFGARGAPGDKRLIGLGMLPRGEVGLIFAAIGLQSGVLGDDLYAALLLVVLVTTLVTPPLLKRRYSRLRDATRPMSTPPDTPPPEGGWLRVGLDEVGLTGRPPDQVAVPVAFDAAIFLARRRPAPELLDWLGDVALAPVTWTPDLTSHLIDVIERGNQRSWRFLESVGVLDVAVPEVADAFRRRARDDFALDSSGDPHIRIMGRLRLLDEDDPVSGEVRRLHHVDRLLLAGFLVEALEDEPDPDGSAGATLARLALEAGEREAILELVADRQLLWSAAHQAGALTEERVLQLAAHLDTPERARALYVLTVLHAENRERWELQRLRTLHELVQAALADDDLAGGEARHLAQRRIEAAARLLSGEPGPLQRLRSAPHMYVLRTPSGALARHARLLHPPPARQARVEVTSAHEGGWWVDVAWHDDPGRLAAITKALASQDLTVADAVLATWPDGAVLDAFRIPLGPRADADRLVAAIHQAVNEPLTAPPLADAELTIDSTASPWHTVCEVRSTDRPGLLNALATALAAAGIEVRSAEVSAHDGLVIDRFEVTDSDGAKLNPDHVERLRHFVRSGVTAKRRRLGRRLSVKAALQP